MTERDGAFSRWHSSGGPWEDAYGYSRAIRTGDRILVSGCTAAVDGGIAHHGDAGAQMHAALDCVVDAVTTLGGRLGDVIRTRMYVVNRADCDVVGRVHGERFAEVRPAATMIVVAGLIDEEMLVEVEAEAVVRPAKPDSNGGRSHVGLGIARRTSPDDAAAGPASASSGVDITRR